MDLKTICEKREDDTISEKEFSTAMADAGFIDRGNHYLWENHEDRFSYVLMNPMVKGTATFSVDAEGKETVDSLLHEYKVKGQRDHIRRMTGLAAGVIAGGFVGLGIVSLGISYESVTETLKYLAGGIASFAVGGFLGFCSGDIVNDHSQYKRQRALERYIWSGMVSARKYDYKIIEEAMGGSLESKPGLKKDQIMDPSIPLEVYLL